MLDIAEHRQKLILKNLAQLDDRINEIQEECIILYLKSFIGDGAELLSPYQFSNITHIKYDTVINVLKRKVKFKPYQQRRWCYCILYHWDTIIDTLNKKHVAESKNFEKDKFEKNFNEAFWHWATIGRDLKQLDKLKEKVEEMQRNFSPRNK